MALTDFAICVIEAELFDMGGAELIRKIRRDLKDPIRFVPIIVLSSYSQLNGIQDVRDAGANLVLAKPVSPQALFDRIAWLGRTKRAYIESDTYVGPDRRFRLVEPPDGRHKRETDSQPDV